MIESVRDLSESASAGLAHLPDASTSLVFRRTATGPADLLVAGPRTRAAYFTGKDLLLCIRARLRRGTARAALGVPITGLVDRVVPLSDLWGLEGSRLERRLRSLDGDPTLIAEHLEAALDARSRHADGPRPEDDLVHAAANELASAHPSRLPDLAHRLAVSERRLRSLFTENAGLPPKAFTRITRLRAALNSGNLRSLEVPDPFAQFPQASTPFAREGASPTPHSATEALSTPSDQPDGPSALSDRLDVLYSPSDRRDAAFARAAGGAGSTVHQASAANSPQRTAQRTGVPAQLAQPIASPAHLAYATTSSRQIAHATATPSLFAQDAASPAQFGQIGDRSARSGHDADTPTRLAELAAATGYYDQSHMTAEFRSMLGVPPAAFFAGRLPTPSACSGAPAE